MKKRNLKKMLREKQDDYNTLMNAYIEARAEIRALKMELISEDMLNKGAPILEPFIDNNNQYMFQTSPETNQMLYYTSGQLVNSSTKACKTNQTDSF